MQDQKFIKYLLFQKSLPQKIESQKMLFLYCCVATLKVLNADFPQQSILDFLKQMLLHDHQYKASLIDDSEASIVNSYCAIAILKLLKQEIQINEVEAYKFIDSLLCEDGNIKFSHTSIDADLRMVYSAMAYLDMLQIDVHKYQNSIGKFILSCQNPDAGFGLRPYLESHSGATYCAVAALTILKIPIPHQSRLIEWLHNRQCKFTGGLAGRINKVPDSCYSFWIGWCLNILGTNLLCKDRLLEYIQYCHSDTGGYSKYPQSQADPVHTLHSLFGSVENDYDYIHAILNNIQ